MKPFSRLSLRHPLSLLGASLATVAGILILLLLAAELTGHEVNPYFALLAILALPALLVAGLLMIPIGSWLGHRRAARPYPVFDINLPSHRAGLIIFLALTAVNLALLSWAGYSGVHYVDSPRFCGQVCHSVMHPEFTAWQSSPHASVACVACHVGPGPGNFMRSKINGVSQLVSLMTGEYERPIPVPVQNLRPATETCERCHWPQLDQGNRLKVKTSFLDDEANTQQSTVMMLKVGGGTGEAGGSGIHWHMNLANKVTYVPSDPTRQTIPWVRLTDPSGKVTEYLATGASRPSDQEIGQLGRSMDCVDCHNRPAHVFAPANVAVDEALAGGRLPRDVPYMRKAVLHAVSEEYPTTQAAEPGIKERIAKFYEENHPEVARGRAADISRASLEAVAIYQRNVFPEMRIGWSAYQSMIGHNDAPGCFRCHDGEHVSADGKAITNDCETCHTLLAAEEPDPQILKDLFP